MSEHEPRLAVLGWSDRTERLLAELHAHGRYTVVGVGDRSATALIRARRATNAPAFQHTAEMVRRLDYDTLLLAGPAATEELAAAAASRGAQLIAEAETLPAAALDALATAAVRHSVPLALARPLLRQPAIQALIALIDSGPAWRPALVQLDLRGPRPTEAQLRDAVALATRLIPAAPAQVTAAAAHAADHLAAQLRYPRERLLVLGATTAAAQGISILVRAPAAEIAVEAPADSQATLRVQPSEGAPSLQTFASDAGLAGEAAHIATALAGDATDLRLAHREAAILGALESALSTGQTHHVADPGVRSTLRMLAGGAHGSSSPAGRLQLLDREAAG